MKRPLVYGPDARKDYTTEAVELFARFADNHRLAYAVLDAPVEVLWEFPVQDGLTLPVTLGLQNNDELNFGVPGFWSYFFPYPSVHTAFAETLDAWVVGRARIHNRGYWRGRVLEILTASGWTRIYTAHMPIRWRHATKIIQNRPVDESRARLA
jgi:hypothetical protein